MDVAFAPAGGVPTLVTDDTASVPGVGAIVVTAVVVEVVVDAIGALLDNDCVPGLTLKVTSYAPYEREVTPLRVVDAKVVCAPPVTK